MKKFLILKDILPTISHRLIKKEVLISIQQDNLLFSLNILKTHGNFRYNLLSCISGIDLLSKTYRFCVSYDILSLKFNARIRLKVFIDESVRIMSSVHIYINAEWWEREIWDLYGIYFTKHNDLRRLLTDYGFEGHPLRKDFPLYGYIELRYNDTKKRIVSDRVQLTQEIRTYYYDSSW